MSAAACWVARAIAEGSDPKVRQRGLTEEDAGEWQILTLRAPGGAVIPQELWEEVFVILTDLGRIEFNTGLRFWHGDCLADDYSGKAMAFRLRLARRALALDLRAFYEPLSLDEKHGQAVEASSLVLLLNDGILERLCERHGIPFEWLAFGVACEIAAKLLAGD
jgi:hypothetical protein